MEIKLVNFLLGSLLSVHKIRRETLLKEFEFSSTLTNSVFVLEFKTCAVFVSLCCYVYIIEDLVFNWAEWYIVIHVYLTLASEMRLFCCCLRCYVVMFNIICRNMS